MSMCKGFFMFLVDQGNPTIGSDEEEQTWYICSWGLNVYKRNMLPLQFQNHMNFLCKNYNPSVGDATYEDYVQGSSDKKVSACMQKLCIQMMGNMVSAS